MRKGLFLVLLLAFASPANSQGLVGTDRLLGRDSPGTGQVEQLTVGGGLGFTGAGGITISDPELSCITGLVSAADKFPYFTGSGTCALADLSAAERTFLTTPSVGNLATVLTDEAVGWANFQTTPTIANLATFLTDEAAGWANLQTTPSSANLATFITDETGTGLLAFGTSPRITTDIAPASSGASTLGTVGLPWGDAFFASGKKLDWANGNCSVTHSTGLLTSSCPLSLGANALTVNTVELANGTANTLAASGGHMTIEGATVWDSGNDGSGSGLDADLLDGKTTGTSGNTIPLLDGNNTWSGSLTYTGEDTPPQITADQNDYAPTGFANAFMLHLTSDASRNITGIAGGIDGRILVVHNDGAQNIVLVDASGLSSANNRFDNGLDITIAAKCAAWLHYDSTKWHVIGGSCGGGGGASTTEPFVTVGNSGTLSAERAITAGGGIYNADGGAGTTLTQYLKTITPQGRLTLESGVPVSVTDQLAKTTVYYTPTNGQLVPIYDGTRFLSYEFSELSAAMGANWAAESAFDWFVGRDSGTTRLCSGPAWTYSSTITVTIATPAVVTWTTHGLHEGQAIVFTTTGALPTGITAGTIYYVGRSPAASTFNIATSIANAAAGTFVNTSGSQSGVHTGTVSDFSRGTGAGTTELERISGILVNKNSMTCRYGNASTFTCAADQCTYLGTMRTTGSTGTTESSTANRFIWNMYNRIRRPMQVTEATDSWTYTTATIRQANGAVGNRLSFIRGLDEEMVEGSVAALVSNATSGAGFVDVGVGLDSTTAFATGSAWTEELVIQNDQRTHYGSYSGTPGLGSHYLSWLERGGGAGSNVWYGDAGIALAFGIRGMVLQ